LTVIGIGGAGCNVVNDLVDIGLKNDITTVSVNTDVKVLSNSKSGKTLQIGSGITQGYGTGACVDVGIAAAKESQNEVEEIIKETDAAFLISGLGGGTGTGATSMIAELCKEKNILTMGIFLMPFEFEGKKKMEGALNGLQKLRTVCDSYIVVPNITEDNITYLENLENVNQIIHSQLDGLSDIIEKTGIINLDFSDLKQVLKQGRTVILSGEGKVEQVLHSIKSSPLLHDLNLKSASSVLISIVGPPDITGKEITTISSGIMEELDENIRCFNEIRIDHELDDKIKAFVILSGIEDASKKHEKVPLQLPKFSIPSLPVHAVPNPVLLLSRLRNSRWW
jgi:cell division protein FtsZ